MSLKRLLLSKTSVLAQMSALTAAVFLSTIVPQQIAVPAVKIQAWRSSHRAVVPLLDFLGAHHVYTTPWFALLVSLAFLSLSLSCVQQVSLAWRTTFGAASPATQGVTVACGLPRIVAVLKRYGYLPLSSTGGVLRSVKHPWGYWGNALLHIGMVITLAASLYIALTQQRGVVFLSEGELFPPRTPWQAEEHGILARVLELPVTVRLDRLRLTLTQDGHIGQAASDVTFIDGNDAVTHRTVGINEILDYGHFSLYQRSDYGDMFAVEFSDEEGVRHVESLAIGLPTSPEEASYRDFAFKWLPFRLSVKYYADVARKSMASPDRQLVLRLVDAGGRERGRVALQKGETGKLGGYTVRLLEVGKWSGLTFVRLRGMPVVFAGFFVIVLGVALTYFLPPRELIVTPRADGFLISWRAVRFREFYRDEPAQILGELKGEGDKG